MFGAMQAVIETGGKQYIVKEGDVIEIERVPQAPEEEIVFDKVLLVKKNGEALVGTPYVNGAKVIGKVLEHFKGEKIIVFKYKKRKNYRRKRGHRQLYSKVQILEIKV